MASKSAGKKITTVVTEEPIADEIQPEVIQEPLPAELLQAGEQSPDPNDYDLRKFFEQFGDDECRVKVYKFDASGRTKFVTECDIESATELFLQENWGEGKYKLTLWDGNKDYKGGKTLLVGPGKAKPLHPEEPEKENPPAAPVPDANQGFMAFMLESMRHSNEMMVRMMENLGNKGSDKSSARELAEILAILKANDGNKSDSISPTKMIAEFMPVIKEFISLASRGGAPERNWMDTIKDVAVEIPGAIKAFGMVKAAEQAHVQNRPVPGGSTTTPDDIMRESAMKKLQIEGMTDEDIMKLQLALEFLKGRARGGKDPNTFVFYVLDTLDDDQSMAVAKLLDRSYDEIAILDPELLSNVYRPWFERFFGGLKNALSERDDTGGEDGDGDDPAEDEGTHTVGVSIQSSD